jgi:predicted nucleic acid-binding protein
VRPIFAAIGEGRIAAVTSALTLLEVLVVPLREGQAALAQRYEDLLANSRGLRMSGIDREQIRGAAQLRARWPKLGTADALQLVAAIRAGCSSFVTNDRRLPAVGGLRILQLKDFAARRR